MNGAGEAVPSSKETDDAPLDHETTPGPDDGAGAPVPTTDMADGQGPAGATHEPVEGPWSHGTAAPEGGPEPPGRGAAIAMYVVCIAIPIGFFLGPLAAFIIWRVRRDEPFLDFHGRQVLDIVITAVLVGGGLYLAGRLIQQVWPRVGIVVQWAALGVVVVQFLLLIWGAATAVRSEDRALSASLRILRRRRDA